ncbi:unnamed protein product [Rhodiola kirilowii]
MSSLSFFASNAIGTLDSRISAASTPLPSPMKLKLNSLLNASFDFPRFKLRNFAFRKRLNRVSCNLHTFPVNTRNYEQFLDGSSEVELRVKLESAEAIGPMDIVLDAGETTLTIKVRRYGLLTTVVEIGRLFDRIRPSETIWYIDENELVVSLKKQDIELKWPDILESWVSLTTVAAQLLKGTSIYLVGESTEINQIVARELSAGLGYAPIATKELLETISNQTIDSWMAAEGSESVAEAESSVFESLSTQVRAVVGTLGGRPGAAGRPAKWRHLYAGFTVWLSKSEAADEASANEEAKRDFQDSGVGYSNADVVVKLQGWNTDQAKPVAQAALSALKQLILSDKKLTAKKSLYIRLGCRGDWPNIELAGLDTSADGASPPNVS